ncbi:MAG: hypothetical protein KF854_04640 [Nitrospira sp.]|nr:hypothetical protein [Nitrospira sp.]
MARTIESIRRWSDIPLIIQLAHAGRKASTDIPWEGGNFLRPQARVADCRPVANPVCCKRRASA